MTSSATRSMLSLVEEGEIEASGRRKRPRSPGRGYDIAATTDISSSNSSSSSGSTCDDHSERSARSRCNHRDNTFLPPPPPPAESRRQQVNRRCPPPPPFFGGGEWRRQQQHLQQQQQRRDHQHEHPRHLGVGRPSYEKNVNGEDCCSHRRFGSRLNHHPRGGSLFERSGGMDRRGSAASSSLADSSSCYNNRMMMEDHHHRRGSFASAVSSTNDRRSSLASASTTTTTTVTAVRRDSMGSVVSGVSSSSGMLSRAAVDRKPATAAIVPSGWLKPKKRKIEVVRRAVDDAGESNNNKSSNKPQVLPCVPRRTPDGKSTTKNEDDDEKNTGPAAGSSQISAGKSAAVASTTITKGARDEKLARLKKFKKRKESDGKNSAEDKPRAREADKESRAEGSRNCQIIKGSKTAGDEKCIPAKSPCAEKAKERRAADAVVDKTQHSTEGKMAASSLDEARRLLKLKKLKKAKALADVDAGANNKAKTATKAAATRTGPTTEASRELQEKQASSSAKAQKRSQKRSDAATDARDRKAAVKKPAAKLRKHTEGLTMVVASRPGASKKPPGSSGRIDATRSNKQSEKQHNSCKRKRGPVFEDSDDDGGKIVRKKAKGTPNVTPHSTASSTKKKKTNKMARPKTTGKSVSSVPTRADDRNRQMLAPAPPTIKADSSIFDATPKQMVPGTAATLVTATPDLTEASIASDTLALDVAPVPSTIVMPELIMRQDSFTQSRSSAEANSAVVSDVSLGSERDGLGRAPLHGFRVAGCVNDASSKRNESNDGAAACDDSSSSSSESETDEEELMLWAQKMFGITPPRPIARKKASPQTTATMDVAWDDAANTQQEDTIEYTSSGGEIAQKQVVPTSFQKTENAFSPPRRPEASSGASTKKVKKRSSYKTPVEKNRKQGMSVEPTLPKQKTEAALEKQQRVEEKLKKRRLEERRKKESARPLTNKQLEAIWAEDDNDDSHPSSHWVRRSVRQPSKSLLSSTIVQSFLHKIRANDDDMVVLKMKKYLGDPDAPSVVIDAVLDALEDNTNCEALYIQNFNEGVRDKQVMHLLRILQQPTCRIWCLNIGETYNVRTRTWKAFAKGLKHTKVTHMYASEHTISAALKDRMRNKIRANRSKHDMHNNPENLDVIVKCTHCWWNPINAKVLRPYLKKRGFEHILHDKEVQGLRGSTSVPTV